MARPPVPLSTLRCDPSRNHRQDSRPEWSRFSFSVGLSHPLQCAGLSRRSPSPYLPSRIVRVVDIKGVVKLPVFGLTTPTSSAYTAKCLWLPLLTRGGRHQLLHEALTIPKS